MNNVINVLNDVEDLLTASITGVEVFSKSKEPACTGEYIVLDHLPFAFENVVENTVVTIHVHVPNLPDGRHNQQRLYELRDKVISLIPDDTFMNGYYMDIRSISDSIADEDDNTHYISIEVTVTYNNLKY